MAANSIKGLIQEMSSATGQYEIMEGTVISEDPFQIQMLNNDLLIINDRITIIPMYLTDYIVNADFEVPAEKLESYTTSGDQVQSISVTKGVITIYNSLKAGDMVYVASLNNGKKFIVLDRITPAVLE